MDVVVIGPPLNGEERPVTMVTNITMTTRGVNVLFHSVSPAVSHSPLSRGTWCTRSAPPGRLTTSAPRPWNAVVFLIFAIYVLNARSSPVERGLQGGPAPSRGPPGTGNGALGGSFRPAPHRSGVTAAESCGNHRAHPRCRGQRSSRKVIQWAHGGALLCGPFMCGWTTVVRPSFPGAECASRRPGRGGAGRRGPRDRRVIAEHVT